jgi:hypothetical protein
MAPVEPVAPVGPVEPAGIAFIAASISSAHSELIEAKNCQPTLIILAVVVPWARTIEVIMLPDTPVTKIISALL